MTKSNLRPDSLHSSFKKVGISFLSRLSADVRGWQLFYAHIVELRNEPECWRPPWYFAPECHFHQRQKTALAKQFSCVLSISRRQRWFLSTFSPYRAAFGTNLHHQKDELQSQATNKLASTISSRLRLGKLPQLMCLLPEELDTLSNRLLHLADNRFQQYKRINNIHICQFS